MTLPDRIKLIDDMIKESPDYTISDYLDLVAEIENINPEDMGSRKGIPNVVPDKRRTIIHMAKTMDVVDICRIMGISPDCVYKTCNRYGPGVWALRQPEVKEPPLELVVPKPRKKERPPAEYSNHSPFGIAS